MICFVVQQIQACLLNKSLNLAAALGVVNLKTIVPTYQVAICLDEHHFDWMFNKLCLLS